MTGRRAEIFGLTLVAGMAGLSYELLYARLLGQYLGEAFHVRAAVLAVFLLAIAVGSGLTPRARGHLPAIQCALGSFAVAVAAVHATAFESIATHVIPLVSTSAVVTLGVVAVFLVGPAVALGLAVPLFAESLPGRERYSWSYGLYNIGAAFSILAIEYLALRTLGLTVTLAVVGAVDVLIGARLHLLLRRSRPQTSSGPASAPTQRFALLVALGVLSSTYQMFALKQAQVFWGPFSETFALHLFVVIAAIGATSLALTRWRVRFDRWLGVVAYGLPLALLLPSLLLPLYPGAVEAAAPIPRALWQIGFFCAVFVPPFVLIAGTLPTYWSSHPEQRGWRAFAAVSVGNSAGFVAYILLVHPLLGDLAIASSVTVGFVAVAVVHRRAPAPALGLVAVGALLLGFDERHMQMSFRDFYSAEAYARARSREDDVEVVRVHDNTLVHRTAASGASSATVDGHRTLRIHGTQGNVPELLHGVLVLGYARDRERALSLGVGTGISTGALAESFDHVTAVEVSPAVLDALPRFEAHNFGLGSRTDVDLVLGDGMTYLYRRPTRYDVILSTVDGPFYRSSSKLYSVEFFELARARLRPNGVYAFWLDQAYSRAVNETIVATARSVFDTCHVAALNGGYVQVICGGPSLTWRPIDALSPALDAKLETTVPDFADAHRLFYFGATGLAASPPSVPLNTLDRPVLEFAKTLHVRSNVSLLSVLEADLAATPEGQLSAEQVSARCRLLSTTGGAPSECGQVHVPQL